MCPLSTVCVCHCVLVCASVCYYMLMHVLTCDLAGVVVGDVIVSAAVLQLLLLLQQCHAHQMEHLFTHREITQFTQLQKHHTLGIYWSFSCQRTTASLKGHNEENIPT